jgi:hypothetical protein
MSFSDLVRGARLNESDVPAPKEAHVP